MKVVTYNIRFGIGRDQKYDLGRIADEVQGADIIAMQEVERFWRRTAMNDQPQLLGELLKGYYWAYCPAFDTDASIKNESGEVLNRRRQFGTMLLSRWPILSTRDLVLPQLATVNLISMSTGALEAVIDTPDGPLRVYSLHLSSISPNERLLQIDALLEMNEMIERCGAVMMGVGAGTPDNQLEAEHIENMDWSNGEDPLPVPLNTLFMGDFNCTDESREYTRFLGEMDPIYGRGMHPRSLVDSWSVAAETTGEAFTWWPDPPDRLPGHPLRVDHCFVNSELAPKVKRCWVDTDATGSDHKPYWVEFD
jgi:endonuclease/exonuclease/phosphatase family metal-dependent hydrolase